MPLTTSPIILKTPKGPLTGSKPVNGFQIISIKEFNNNPNISNTTRYNPHQLYFDLIIVFTEGSGVHNVDFIDYKYGPGSIFILKKNQCHHWYPNHEIDGFLLFFSEGFESNFSKIFSSLIFSNTSLILPKPNFDIVDTAKLHSYISLLDVIMLESSIENQKVLPFLLAGFMAKLELDYTAFFPSLKFSKSILLFQKFQELLNNDIKSSRNGSYYIAKLNTSFNHMNLTCKLITSYTLKQYIDNFIITKAKILLSNDTKNISDIAFDLGFHEVGNFSKFFKKRTGLKPNEFRNNLGV